MEKTSFLAPTDRILHIRGIEALQTLPVPLVAGMAIHAEERFFQAGEKLFQEGEAVHRFHLLVEGKVRLMRRGYLVRMAEAPTGVGFLECVSQYPEGVDAEAIEDSLTLTVDGDRLMDTFDDSFEFYLNSLKNVAQLILEFARTQPDGLRHIPWDEPLAPVGRDLNTVERILVYRRSRPFREGAMSALGQLARMAVEERFAVGESLWRRGDAADSTFLIASGEVRCEAEDRTIVYGPGFPLGGPETLAQQPRWYDAVAINPVHGLRSYRVNMLDVWEDHSDLAMSFLGSLARTHIENIQARIESEVNTVGRNT